MADVNFNEEFKDKGLKNAGWLIIIVVLILTSASGVIEDANSNLNEEQIQYNTLELHWID